MAENDSDLGDLEAGVRQRNLAALVSYLQVRKAALLAVIDRRLGADLRRRLEPEDVYQETVLAALNELPRLPEGPSDPFAWLCHLSEQRVIDLARHHRAAKRDPRREIGPAPSPEESKADFIALLAASLTSASKAAMRGERQARVDSCLARLPETTRDILRLRYVDGLPTREIADRLGKTDVAIRVLLSRAVQELQKQLADDSAGL